MFKTSIVCPKGSISIDSCKGFRKDGITLKNSCAICPAYRKYLKENFPSDEIPARTII